MKEAQQAIGDGVREWEAVPHTDLGNQEWQAAMKTWRAADATAAEIQAERNRLLGMGMGAKVPKVAALDAGAPDAMAQVMAAVGPADEALEDLDALFSEVATGEGRHAVEAGTFRSMLLLGLSPALTMVLLTFAWLLTKYIKRTLACIGENLDRLAVGDVPSKVEEDRDKEFNRGRDGFNTLVDTMNALVTDTGMLAGVAVEGRLTVRSDASRHQGAYRRIVDGVNATVATLVGHHDAPHSSAMIIERELRVRDFNGSALKVVGRDLGQRCSDLFRTDDCGTGRCACARAMNRNKLASSETTARPGKEALEIAHPAVPVKDAAGNVLGAVEAITDQTAVKTAMRQAQEVSEYHGKETTRVVAALEKLSRGDLAIDAAEAAGDADTAEARRAFEEISEAILRSAEAVHALTRDVASLSEAAIAGMLAARADATRYQGAFR